MAPSVAEVAGSIVSELKAALVSEFSSANGKAAVDRIERLCFEVANAAIEARLGPVGGLADGLLKSGEQAAVDFTNAELDKLAASAAQATQAAQAAASQAQAAQAALIAAKAKAGR